MEVPGRRVNDDRAIHLARGEPMTSLDRRGVAATSAAYGAPHYPDADFLPVCGYRGTWTGEAIGMCVNPTGVGCPACREVLANDTESLQRLLGAALATVQGEGWPESLAQADVLLADAGIEVGDSAGDQYREGDFACHLRWVLGQLREIADRKPTGLLAIQAMNSWEGFALSARDGGMAL